MNLHKFGVCVTKIIVMFPLHSPRPCSGIDFLKKIGSKMTSDSMKRLLRKFHYIINKRRFDGWSKRMKQYFFLLLRSLCLRWRRVINRYYAFTTLLTTGAINW